MHTITSSHNPLVVATVKLKQKKFRRASGSYLVEGVKMVRDAFATRQTVLKLFVQERAVDGLRELVVLAEEKGVAVYCLSEESFAKLSDTVATQGVVAEIFGGESTLLPPTGDSLILDRISDPGNMGTIIRTAVAAGFGELYLIDCTDPYGDKAVRSSMSGVYRVKLMNCAEEQAIALHRAAGNVLIAADMSGENALTAQVPVGKRTLIIGNEAHGVSKSLLANAARVWSVPMQKGCESLNASVAAAILMYRVLQGENA